MDKSDKCTNAEEYFINNIPAERQTENMLRDLKDFCRCDIPSCKEARNLNRFKKDS